MKPNIGMINALIRITCGLTMLAWATSKLVRRPYQSMSFFAAAMGAMKVAEGITRFCPITYLFEEKAHNFNQNDEYSSQNHNSNSEFSEEIPANPS